MCQSSEKPQAINIHLYTDFVSLYGTGGKTCTGCLKMNASSYDSIYLNILLMKMN